MHHREVAGSDGSLHRHWCNSGGSDADMALHVRHWEQQVGYRRVSPASCMRRTASIRFKMCTHQRRRVVQQGRGSTVTDVERQTPHTRTAGAQRFPLLGRHDIVELCYNRRICTRSKDPSSGVEYTSHGGASLSLLIHVLNIHSICLDACLQSRTHLLDARAMRGTPC